MGLTSFFKRDAGSTQGAGAGSDPADAVQHARTRARQRLIGAIVLVGIGIVAFPLVFETQPRPIPVDIPIEVPRKESALPLAMPPARTPAVVAPAPAPRAAEEAAVKPGIDAGEVITESRDEAGIAASKPAAAVPPAPAPKPADAKPHPTPDDGARARALLEGKTNLVATAATPQKTTSPVPPAAGDGARFVVQVGAFADAGAARDTRLKVEQLGMKTYTQVASTASGNRIRVRVGPFATRDEADKALAKARAAGLTAVVLTL